MTFLIQSSAASIAEMLLEHVLRNAFLASTDFSSDSPCSNEEMMNFTNNTESSGITCSPNLRTKSSAVGTWFSVMYFHTHALVSWLYPCIVAYETRSMISSTSLIGVPSSHSNAFLMSSVVVKKLFVLKAFGKLSKTGLFSFAALRTASVPV